MPAGPKDFGEEIDFERYTNILRNNKGSNIVDSYYIVSELSYESDRCMLHGNTIIHYIIKVLKFIIKTLIRLIIRVIFILLLNPYTYLLLAVLFVIYAILLPVIKKYWKQFNGLICKVKNIGFDAKSIPEIEFFGGAKVMGVGIPRIALPAIPIIPEFKPFKTMIDAAFPGVFNCVEKGSNWNDVKYGTCENRFAGGRKKNASETEGLPGCEKQFATDYSLWSNDSLTIEEKNTLGGDDDDTYILCNNKIFCPDAPQNYLISNTSIGSLSPTIDNGLGKGTSPYKYLACCENSTQKCQFTEEAKKSINFASGRPDLKYDNIKQYFTGMGIIEDPSEREMIFPNENDKQKFGPFMPLTMYQITNKNFDPLSVLINKGDIPDKCIQVSSVMEKIKKWIWILIVIFFVYELYWFIYDIIYAEKMIDECGEDTKKIRSKVENYLCGRPFDGNAGDPCSNKTKQIKAFSSCRL